MLCKSGNRLAPPGHHHLFMALRLPVRPFIGCGTVSSFPSSPPSPRITRASLPLIIMVLSDDMDLLHPPAELEKSKHKLKRLVQSPNSFFMDVKCQGCFTITTVFSHSQTPVQCAGCTTILCQPSGGRARLTEGCSFRRKGD